MTKTSENKKKEVSLSEADRGSKEWKKIYQELKSSIDTDDDLTDAHLRLLVILSDLFVEYQEVAEIIKKEGRAYKAITQHGFAWREHPCVNQKIKIVQQIKSYSTMLGIKLSEVTNPKAEIYDDWD